MADEKKVAVSDIILQEPLGMPWFNEKTVWLHYTPRLIGQMSSDEFPRQNGSSRRSF